MCTPSHTQLPRLKVKGRIPECGGSTRAYLRPFSIPTSSSYSDQHSMNSPHTCKSLHTDRNYPRAERGKTQTPSPNTSSPGNIYMFYVKSQGGYVCSPSPFIASLSPLWESTRAPMLVLSSIYLRDMRESAQSSSQLAAISRWFMFTASPPL